MATGHSPSLPTGCARSLNESFTLYVKRAFNLSNMNNIMEQSAILKKGYWNLKDLTERFKCSKRTIYRWLKLPQNPFPKPKIEQLGVSSLWSVEDVLAWESSMSKVA